MKKAVYILLCCAFMSVNTQAQEAKTIKTDTLKSDLKPLTSISKMAENMSVAICPDESALEARPVYNEQEPDSLHLPMLNSYGQMPVCIYPIGWAGLYNWQLHEGLNVNVGLSVAGSFGKGSSNKTAFAQNVAAIYAIKLAPKLSLALGGYFSNVYYGRSSSRDGGINAVMGYKFNDHWEAYLYGQKSISKRKMPLFLYDINGLGDRIGAAVKYNFSPNFSMQLSVEERKH